MASIPASWRAIWHTAADKLNDLFEASIKGKSEEDYTKEVTDKLAGKGMKDEDINALIES